MEVVCLESEALYALIDKVLERFREQGKIQTELKWVGTKEAMEMLNIKSKVTLQKFRDEGRIRFSQPVKKIILYDVDSIHAFINKHSKGTL